jgi:5-methyltetrahydrofolate--homocysteine methyltransferase
MQTVLRSIGKEVIIDIERPFVIIGESINPTGHRKLKEALLEKEFDYIRQLAVHQVETGADVLDVNVGIPEIDEVAMLPEVIQLVASVVDVPICIDSANPEALAAGLSVAPGKALVNSVNGEEAMLKSVLPIVKSHGAAVIGLTMDQDGIPSDPEQRIAIAGKILEHAAREGVLAEDVVIDPLVLAVGVDSNAGVITLQSIEMIQREFGVNINLGASNISFGLPERQVINQAFLALTIQAGASCAITNPMKLTSTVRAIELLLGRDPFAGRYISHYRSLHSKED